LHVGCDILWEDEVEVSRHFQGHGKAERETESSTFPILNVSWMSNVSFLFMPVVIFEADDKMTAQPLSL